MYATLDLWLSSLRSLPGEMDETDALRSKRCNEDAVSLAPSTTESIIVEGEWTESATVSVLVDSLGGYNFCFSACSVRIYAVCGVRAELTFFH